MAKVFVTRPFPGNGIQMLRDKGYDVVVNEAAADRPATSQEVMEGVRGVDALLSILTEKIDASIMDAGLPTLKIVANYAVGFDNVDIAAAQKRGILVTNAANDLVTEAVAEHTFAFMLSLARRIVETDDYARDGKYMGWGPSLLVGSSLAGKTLGIVGLGRIGFRVAHHATRSFGMQVVYTDPKKNIEFEAEHHARFVSSIDELLGQCDFVSLHVPLLDSTRHLINAERLRLMKPTAYLVNTSRGPVIDEAALVTALSAGIIKGAALDVFEHEPTITQDLLRMKNVVLTPHTASATIEAREKMGEVAATNIIEALEGRTPPNLCT